MDTLRGYLKRPQRKPESKRQQAARSITPVGENAGQILPALSRFAKAGLCDACRTIEISSSMSPNPQALVEQGENFNCPMCRLIRVVKPQGSEFEEETEHFSIQPYFEVVYTATQSPMRVVGGFTFNGLKSTSLVFLADECEF